MDHPQNERGATAIIVAVLMVALLGFAAISIDVGKLYWEKAQLQNGADAGAMAVATICSNEAGNAACFPGSPVAKSLADGNANDGASNVTAVVVDTAAGRATVDTAASEAGATPNSVTLWFANVLGFSETEVSATATATWGEPTDLTSKFPLAFSKCEIDSGPTFDGNLQFLMSHGVEDVPKNDSPGGGEKESKDSCTSTGSGQEIPGGFGWLAQEPAESCSTNTRIGDWEATDSGNNLKGGCEEVLAEWKRILQNGGEVVALLPVFDDVQGTGAGGEFHIYAYAAIDIKGWTFNGHSSDYLPPEAAQVIKDGGYKNSDLGFVGRFIRYSFDDEEASGGTKTTTTGASIVRLAE